MDHTIHISAKVPESRKVELTLPREVPVGDAELTVVVTPKKRRRASTGADLLNSEIFGMWKDRTDIEDSAAYARELRQRAWKRSA